MVKANNETLYNRLIISFKEQILSGKWAPGLKLPTELELSKIHQLSRGTVRLALSNLENEGLLERVQGRGTFVRANLPTPEPTPIRRERRIGLVLNRPVTAQINFEIMVGVEQAIKARGYQLSFAYCEENQEQQYQDIIRMLDDQVAGLVIFPVSDKESDKSIELLRSKNVPFVLVDRYLPHFDSDYVVVDNVGGAYRATQHLLILGHRNIGFGFNNIESLHTTSVRSRWEGYCKALEDYQIPYDEKLIFHQPKAGEGTLQAEFEKFLFQAKKPTAIFAVNDYLALEMLQAAHRAGIKVPEELALIGFDDTSFSSHLSPPLTTVSQPLLDLGFRAGDLIINRINGQVGSYKHRVLPTNLIIRESCGSRLQILKSLAS
jgi:GntR family transcriptional regulator, arabinose operon transcriptional repressor